MPSAKYTRLTLPFARLALLIAPRFCGEPDKRHLII